MRFLLPILLLAPRLAFAQDVLVLSDGETAAVQNTLEAAGYVVDVAPGLETAYDGDPDPSTYCAVLHLNGETYDTAMPVAGQTALADCVDAGGGYIGMEWNAYEAGGMATMTDLIIMTRTSGHEGLRQYNVSADGLRTP